MLTKRILLSIWCGITIPFAYILTVGVVISLLGNKLSHQNEELLFLPLALPSKLYECFFEQKVKDLGDALGIAADTFVFSLFGNFILYALLTFIVLLILNKTNVKSRLVNFIKVRAWKR